MFRRRVIVWPLVILVLGILAGTLSRLGLLLNLICLVPVLIIVAIAGAIQDRKKRLSDLLKRAGRLRERGDRERAIELYRQVLTMDATHPRACLEVGDAYSEAAQLEQAEAAYRSALEGVDAAIRSTRRRFPWRTLSVIPDTDGVGHVTAHLALSDLYERQGLSAAAIDEAQAALETVGPTGVEWWLKRLPKRAGRMPEVLAVLLAIQALISTFNVAVELVPTARLFLGEASALWGAIPLLLLGSTLFTLFQFLLAGIEVVLPVAVWTRHRQAGYGVIAVALAQMSETLLEILQGGGQATGAFVSSLNMWTIVSSLVLLVLAVLSLNEYGRSHFDSIRAAVHGRIAALFARLGDEEKAAQHREQAGQLDPVVALKPPERGEIEEKQVLSRRQLLGIYASMISMILLVCGGAVLASQMGWASIAVETNPALGDIYPLIAQIYLERGNTHAQSGNLEQAIADYSRAIELAPDFVDAYNNRGFAYARAGNLEKAFADYGQAIELNPGYALVYLNRGSAYAESGDLERAIADYDRAIELDPGYALAHFNRGLVHAKTGSLEQAIQDYDRAIELEPDYADAYFGRGNAYYVAGDPERALLDYSKVIELAPGFALAYYNRGIVYANAGDTERAVADLERYLELAPDGKEREQAAGLIRVLAGGQYAHPSGAFGFALPGGWEIVQEDQISALASDGVSLAGVEFHDVGTVYTKDEMQGYAADFVGAILEEAQIEVLDVPPAFTYVGAAFTGSDGRANRADFFFEQHETVVFIFFFVTPAERYEENLSVRDLLLKTYQVDPGAVQANP